MVCNDVIEHMADHDRFLRQIRGHIAPGGVLIGSVPNMRHYRALFELLVLRDWDYRDSGVLDRTHLRFFTARSLRRSLTRAGFESGQGSANVARRLVIEMSMQGRTAMPTTIGANLPFQTWLVQLGVRYLTSGSDVGYILSGGRADVRQQRAIPLRSV